MAKLVARLLTEAAFWVQEKENLGRNGCKKYACGIVLARLQSGMHYQGFHVMHHVMQLVMYSCLLLLKEQTFWYTPLCNFAQLTRKRDFVAMEVLYHVTGPKSSGFFSCTYFSSDQFS